MRECPQCKFCFEDSLAYCPNDGGVLTTTLPGSPQLTEKYCLERLLSRGSMGSVYQAQQAELSRPVAIKVLNPQLLTSNVAKERFRREAVAVASLKHPNIITVFDFAVSPQGVFYIAMELLEGETLGDRLAREGRLEVATVIKIASDLCDGLAQAHQKGIIHRDLKPSNIFLNQTTAGEVTKIIDFGLVKLKERADSFKSITSGALIGSLHYSAPEQCRSVEIDARADIYSLGAVLYHALTGKQPFDTPNKAQLIYQHLNARPLPLHRIVFDIPPMLETAVLKALEKDADQRFQTVTEFANAIKQSPKRGLRRTVGMFLSGPIENYRNSAKLAEESQQATQRTLNFEQFIGRKREFAKIRSAFEQASEGRPVSLLVTGDAGVGKSELLHQATKELAAAGALPLTGHFTNAITSPWSLTNLSSYLHQMLLNEPAKFNKIFGQTSQTIQEAISQPVVSQTPTAALFQHKAEKRSERGTDLLAQIYLTLSDFQPLVISIDELHNADDANLNFLSYLLGASPNSRILFLFSVRTEEMARPDSMVANWLDKLASQRQLQRLTLGPLNDNEIRPLLEKIFETITISDSSITRLWNLTEGNPFYLISVLRLLLEEKKIYWETDKWICAELEELKVPPTVADLISARLNSLSLESNKMLEMAAILGETFGFETLRRLINIDEDKLMRIIDEALRYGLLIESPHTGNLNSNFDSLAKDDHYSFAQNALYQVLYQRLSPEERHEKHRSVAIMLATLTKENSNLQPVFSKEIARQYQLAGDQLEAFCHNVISANAIWRTGEIGLAKQYLIEASKLYPAAESRLQSNSMEQLDEETESRIRTNFCDYFLLYVDLKLCGSNTEAEDYLERALNLAQKVAAPILIARVLVASGHYEQHQGDYPKALNYFERALKLYQETENKQRYNVLLEQIAALKAKIKPYQPTADII